MVNPTHIYPPSTEPGPFNLNRHARIGLHEKADGTFVNASPASPVPVSIYGDGDISGASTASTALLLTMSLEQYYGASGHRLVVLTVSVHAGCWRYSGLHGSVTGTYQRSCTSATTM
jgi:hypothetical protein